MDKSAHWPGIGRYIGYVSDVNWFFTRIKTIQEKQNIYIYYFDNETYWQKRRVYQDELDYLNKEIK